MSRIGIALKSIDGAPPDIYFARTETVVIPEYKPPLIENYDFTAGDPVEHSAGKFYPDGWSIYSASNVTSSSVANGVVTFSAPGHLGGISQSVPDWDSANTTQRRTIRARRVGGDSDAVLAIYNGSGPTVVNEDDYTFHNVTQTWVYAIEAGSVLNEWYEFTYDVTVTAAAFTISNFNAAGDWEIEYANVTGVPDADTVFTQNIGALQVVNDAEAVGQHGAQRLKTFYGEWYLDKSCGVTWLTDVLGQKYDSTVSEALINAELLDTSGVVSIESHSSTFDYDTRHLNNFNIVVVTDYDEQVVIS